MASPKKHRSHVRSFERQARIHILLEAGIDDIPADAITARPDYVESCRGSIRCGSCPPYFRDLTFTCKDCGEQAVWTAEDQVYWYEVLHGPVYSTAARCNDCRKRRRGASRAATDGRRFQSGGAIGIVSRERLRHKGFRHESARSTRAERSDPEHTE